jgi:predicted site-specific integrase-resolvase
MLSDGSQGVTALPPLDIYALVTATEAASLAGVSVAAICKWRERGYLPVAVDEDGNEIRDEHNRPRYRYIDVAKAEARTRERAAVMAGRLTARAAAA